MSDSKGNYEVFARKYRPRTFDDVLGQDHVVRTLKNAIDKDRLAHAYLFTGPRGTGKTTIARILAKALNCKGGPLVDFDPDEDTCREIAEGRSLDVQEIDGASNNGVDDVRELRETVKYAPASGKFKIYYIDEVHMLSVSAFNALLKTLEEPPPHVKFIFATTEPGKILATILSRCQRFDLRRIPSGIIADHLLRIAKAEGLTLSEAAAYAIAKGADGGMRDAQSMLDQLVAFCGETIEEANVLEIFGYNSVEAVAEIAGVILRRENATALARVHDQSEAGRDLGKLLADLITHFRLLLVQLVDPGAETEEIAPELRALLESQRDLVSTDRLLRLIDLLAETEGRMKWAPNKKLHLEIGVIKAIRCLGETSIDDVIALLGEAAGAAPAPGPAPARPAAKAPQPASQPAAKPAPAPQPAREKQKTPPSAAPAAQPPAAQPPAAQPPATETAPAATGPLSGAELWKAACSELVAERPLIETWLRAASFLRQDERAFTIGYPTASALYRDSLIRHTDLIEKTLARLAGRKLELKVDLSAELEVGAEPAEEASPAGPELIETPADAETATADTDPTPASAGSGDGDTPVPETGDDFHDDPLITKALADFEATVLDPGD